MEKKIGTMKDLKVGRYVLIDGEPCRVVNAIHSKPGKHGGAKARIDAVGLFDDQKRNLMGPVSQNVDIPILDKKTAQVLNIVGDKVHLMDMTTYETFELPLPEDLKGELNEGVEVLCMTCMGKKKILRVQ
jgi:translation initiation factor 5A